MTLITVESCESQVREYTGSIAGTVLCGDSGKPARLASVRISGNSSSQIVTSDYDGRFTVNQLIAGDYILDTSYPGYSDPLKGKISTDILAGAPKWIHTGEEDIAEVTVAPGRVATAVIVLTHGASVSGTVVYNDGPPSAQVRVETIQLPSDEDSRAFADTSSTDGTAVFSVDTNDRGEFRISGLPPGKYTVEVTVPLPGLRSWFLGDTVELRQAQSIDIVAGSDYQGLSIHLPATTDALLASK